MFFLCTCIRDRLTRTWQNGLWTQGGMIRFDLAGSVLTAFEHASLNSIASTTHCLNSQTARAWVKIAIWKYTPSGSCHCSMTLHRITLSPLAHKWFSDFPSCFNLLWQTESQTYHPSATPSGNRRMKSAQQGHWGGHRFVFSQGKKNNAHAKCVMP